MADEEKLVIKDTKKGEGDGVKEGNTVVVHYRGYFPDGRQFDSSYDRDLPFEVQIGAGYVIRGWDEGIKRRQAHTHCPLPIRIWKIWHGRYSWFCNTYV